MMSFRVIENENKKKSPLHLCVKCERWECFHLYEGGWWHPMCKDWNKEKSKPEDLYGPKSSCPYYLEHVVLIKRGKFKLLSLTDCEPIISLFKTEKVILSPDRYDAFNVCIKRFDRKKKYNMEKIFLLLNGIIQTRTGVFNEA